MTDHAQGAVTGWQPIETAPRDGTRILLRWNKLVGEERVVCGEYSLDEYAKKPKPYWSHDWERIFGRVEARNNPPTHWMPIPGSELTEGDRRGGVA